MGHDDKFLFCQIEDLIIKTVLSIDHVVNNAVDMFLPFKNQCFELFGFDVLIDADLKPWLLEVNLSPALSCDSPLDQKVKSNCIADLLSLAGIVKVDQRHQSDTTAKKAHMAYGAAPGESLASMMRKKPSGGTSKHQSVQLTN